MSIFIFQLSGYEFAGRTVLAANQFQDLFDLVERVSSTQGIPLNKPVLDAGGQLPEQMDIPKEQAGALFNAIRKAYQGGYQILISNLDTIANRLGHPEACRGLTAKLDLIVIDEIHLLSGLYGAHAGMLLKRLALMRCLWNSREAMPQALFEQLLEYRDHVPGPYFIGASATISEPRRHAARLLNIYLEKVMHIDVGQTDSYGWVHHLFLRQRPEASTITAVVNATSCLIHNRRDGVFREYYQRRMENDTSRPPIALSDLNNPVQPSAGVELRGVADIHKTLGFCDSLDGVGRWADLVADNERTKAASMASSPNPAMGSLPYFIRFQEPLWRTVHHLSFGASPKIWHQRLWAYYGGLCRNCKRGIKQQIDRMPSGLTPKQQESVEKLWNFEVVNNGSYLALLEVGAEFYQSEWFQTILQAASQDQIGNLDLCSFFRSGLCWWWSMDHMGSNHPTPASFNDSVNGYKRPLNHPQNFYNYLNAIRLRSFTSQTKFDTLSTSSINDLFRTGARRIFRNPDYDLGGMENCVFIIGSPRIEVGIDLSRVCDGITFRAMRDPASLQQKSGRVGREIMSDSMVVHIVTENARDHFYFRNPLIALDPDYLQPIPLHEGNQVIARNHYFMAIVDFLCLQGSGPIAGRIMNDGDRLVLINDHKYQPSFCRWDQKMLAVHGFLFGNHPRQAANLSNLQAYLKILGAKDDEISNPSVIPNLTPQSAPLSQQVGAVDIFRHEFGPNLLFTPVSVQGAQVTLAQMCATHYPPPSGVTLPGLPRHQEFIQTYHTYHTAEGRSPNPRLDRGYLWKLLTLPIFRRGIPSQNIVGNHPYVWSPNLFQSSGTETVRVFEEINGRRRELGYETVGVAMALLAPGTLTYRYPPSARKVAVSSFGAQGLTPILPRVEGVVLDITNQDYFQPAECNDLGQDDLPDDFIGAGVTIPVFKPRQIGLIYSSSEPRATVDGLLADDDSRPLQSGIVSLPTPPRCFPLRWFRVASSNAYPIPCRFSSRFSSPNGQPLPELPWPEPLNIFSSISFDPRLEVTDYIWGLDRQFMNRQVDPARLVYRQQNLDPAVLGHHYYAPGIRFQLDLRPESPLGLFLHQVWQNFTSGSHQSLVIQVLHAFLARHACQAPATGAPPWAPPSRPSIFTVRNLRTIILFHLLERWHPGPDTSQSPSEPLTLTLDDLAGCFTPGHANYLDENRFQEVCDWVSVVQNPVSAQQRFDTLYGTYENFQRACAQVAQFNENFFKETGKEILLNSLGIAMHAAALRLTGAESSDLAYFYKRHADGTASIYLFDTDQFGNGTVEVIRETFFISSIERVLTAKLRALGGSPDPLPTTDFVSCFEDTLQECVPGQAAQIAYHNLCASGDWDDLLAICSGERQIAGDMFDFMRLQMGLTSFDHTIPFQSCPEFLAHVSRYPIYPGQDLVPSSSYPTFQALESAAGYCISGCVACLVAPEQNIHGQLNAKETVNKLLLDAMYRTVVCQSGTTTANLLYPGTGTSRTVAWSQLLLTVASATGQSLSTQGFDVNLEISGMPNVTVTIVPATFPGSWNRVFRLTWDPVQPPDNRVRPRMAI